MYVSTTVTRKGVSVITNLETLENKYLSYVTDNIGFDNV